MKATLYTLLLLALSATSSFAQDLYSLSQVTNIKITFQQSNWDELLDGFEADGNGERLLASVEINGEVFDSAGVRYRGGESYSSFSNKNPLNIKLDYVDNSDDYQGYTVLKLSNGQKDPSWLREVLGLEIARRYLVAPKANFAHVTVNGTALGVYANVENINADFFSEQFYSDPANARFECSPDYDFFDPPTTPPAGCTLGHGASLEYLGTADACYTEHYDLESDTGWFELRILAELLKNNPQNARTLLDLDRFLWFSAYHSLLANLDSYLGAGVRNYYLFKADNGHFVPVPDDVGKSFARFPWVTLSQLNEPQKPQSYFATLDPFLGSGDEQKPLLKAIFGNATWKRMYVAHLRTMLDGIFGGGWLEQRAGALQGVISDEVLADGNHFYTHDEFLSNLNNTVVDNIDGFDAYGILPFMEARKAFLMGLPEFTAVPPTISEGLPLPGSIAPGSAVWLTATVANASTVWLGHRKNLTEVFSLVQMFDDGAHGDGAAGDGVFGASVTVQTGGLQYYFYAENSAAGVFDPKKAEIEFHTLATSGDVVINELMADNEDAVADQDGEFDDWLELYNNSTASINLAGWFLTDDPLTLNKWAFPAGTFIDPNGFLVVWTDNDDTQSGLHTNFSLNNNGEQVLLVKPNLTVADQLVFGLQPENRSLSRCPDGIGEFHATEHSFGLSNVGPCAVGTGEVLGQFPLAVFPNPADERLVVETTAPGKHRCLLLNVLGQPLRAFALQGKTVVETGDLPQGIYYIKMENALPIKVAIGR